MDDKSKDDLKPVAAKSIDPAALEMLAHADCVTSNGVQSRGHHEALPHRRVRRLLPHLLDGSLPPRRQGRRAEDRPLRRRHGDHRRPQLRATGRGRRRRPLGPRPRHGDDAARRRHRRGRGLQGQGRAEAHVRRRVPGHPHQRPRGQRDRPRRGRRRAGPVRPVARRDRLHQARDAEAAGQVARAGAHPSRHRPRGRRGHAPHARGRRPRRREHPQVGAALLPRRRLGRRHAEHRHQRHPLRHAVAAVVRGQPRRAQGRPGQRDRPRPRADAVGDAGRGRARPRAHRRGQGGRRARASTSPASAVPATRSSCATASRRPATSCTRSSPSSPAPSRSWSSTCSASCRRCGPLSQRFHTKLVTTSPKAKIPGATHIEFDEHRAPETAREIVRLAIANYPNRGPDPHPRTTTSRSSPASATSTSTTCRAASTAARSGR